MTRTMNLQWIGKFVLLISVLALAWPALARSSSHKKREIWPTTPQSQSDRSARSTSSKRNKKSVKRGISFKSYASQNRTEMPKAEIEQKAFVPAPRAPASEPVTAPQTTPLSSPDPNTTTQATSPSPSESPTAASPSEASAPPAIDPQ